MVKKRLSQNKEKRQTAFEKLIQSKNIAKEKKIKKALQYQPSNDNLELLKLKEITNKKVKQKLKKRNLFDLESDGEDMQEIHFHAKKEEELEKNEGFEVEVPQLEGQKKSKK